MLVTDLPYDIHINYLCYLDYTDLFKLSQINKYFNTICNDDNVLKNILCQQMQGIKFTNKFNLVKPLKLLYNAISKLIDENYPESPENYNFQFPKWINIPLFKEEMIRRVYMDLKDRLGKILYNYNDVDKIILDNIKDVNKIILTFPFFALNKEQYLAEASIEDINFLDDINNKLSIDDSVIIYIKSILTAHKDTKYDLNDAIEHLLNHILMMESIIKKIYNYRFFKKDTI